MDLLPEDRAAAEHAVAGWPELVRDHPAWGRVTTGDRDHLLDRAVALAERLSAQRRERLYLLVDDPWQDAGFAGRAVAWVGRLLERLPVGDVTAAEAALLLTAPMAYDTLWSSLAARQRALRPHDLTPSQDATSERAAFERFTLSFTQPRRRAIDAVRRERWDAAEEIGWWLLHRWISRLAEAYQPQAVAELLADQAPTEADQAPTEADPWRPDRLAGLLRVVRADPGFLARTDRTDVLAQVGPDGVREQFVGYLLAAARALAVEVPALPEVIGEHLGVTDPVRASDLLATVRAARWESRGTALVLTASCGHPAVEVALRTHVERLDHLLAEAHRAAASDPASGRATTSLQHLPTHATAEGLHPATVGDGRAYHSAGVRFRLAEDRVRELLMGEHLYGDPALAVRELYQNALDACRYREARTEYLLRAGQAAATAEPWAGRIRFEQGVDESGAAYLDCVDNGIGMGVRELTEVFSQAGVRLADLPEFIEEQAEWERLDPPVRLYPNSRFGIGVLSYFMLADEITVETRRLGLDGRPGQRLRVAIAGPGSLFRIQTVPDDDPEDLDAGTRIRLHLRHDGPSVNCVKVLHELLWVADFHTEACTGTEHRTWQPGKLSRPLRPDPEGGDAKVEWDADVVEAPGTRVWWCAGDGAVLADGLWAGEEFRGAVVNLSRDLAPRLSVDRTRILAYRQEDVDRLLWGAVGPLVEAGPKVLTFEWLYSFTRDRPLVADLVFDSALAAGHREWALHDATVDAGVAGCFGQDLYTFAGPDELVAWRLTALAAAGMYNKVLHPDPDWSRVVMAKPSDRLIISAEVDGSVPWLDPVELVPLVHLVRAARRVGRGASEVADRLEQLGYTCAIGHDTVGTDPDDLIITSRDLDGERPWLSLSEPVGVLHLLRAADETGRPVTEVVARLRQLGHDVDADLDRLPVDRLEPDDSVITSRDLDGRQPVLNPQDEVGLLHVLRAAKRVSRNPAEVAARLASLGYRLAPGCAAVGTSADDVVLASRDLDGTAPWLPTADPVPPIHLLRAAAKLDRSVGEVIDRLRLLGYEITVAAQPLADVQLEADDAVLLSRNLDGKPPWLPVHRAVPPIHLMRAVKEVRRPLAEVVGRLVACGYRVDVDPTTVMADQLEPDDLVLASVDLDGTAPWLPADDPVPLTHLVRAAESTRRDVHDVAARLVILGYGVRLTCGSVTAERFTADDVLITSRDLDAVAPWLDPDEVVPLAHLVLAAGRTRRPVREIAARLTELGYRIDVDMAAFTIEQVEPDDLTLVSEDLDGRKPWLDPTDSVSMAHLAQAAIKVRRPITEVAARLSALGYRVLDLDVWLPRHRPGGA